MKGVPAFAAIFAAVLSFWMAHRKWSRRYGMEYFGSILISMAMVYDRKKQVAEAGED